MAIFMINGAAGKRYARASTQQEARRIFARSLSAFVSLQDVLRFGSDRRSSEVPSPNYTEHGIHSCPCIDPDQGMAIREYYASVSTQELRAAQKGGFDRVRAMYNPQTAREVARAQQITIASSSISFG